MRLINIGLAAILVLAGCVTNQGVRSTNNVAANNASNDCNFDASQGKEFVFRQKSPSIQKYGYHSWKKKPSISGEKLSYSDYVGKHGKIKEQLITGKYNSKWFVAITENCETIYSSARSGRKQKPVNDLEKFTGIYFLETLEKAKPLVGKDIWTKPPFGAKKARVLFTADPGITYPRGNLEKLRVVGVDTTAYGHTFGAVSFSLIVKTESGNEGLLPYSAREFHETNPIKPNWKKTIVALIKQQKVQRGMTAEQVLLSWGKPKRNNRSVGSYGVHEQWVYGDGQYLYFENNVLTSFQTTH